MFSAEMPILGPNTQTIYDYSKLIYNLFICRFACVNEFDKNPVHFIALGYQFVHRFKIVNPPMYLKRSVMSCYLIRIERFDTFSYS